MPTPRPAFTPSTLPSLPRPRHLAVTPTCSASPGGIILAPGQGAQSPNMARTWFETSPAASQLLSSADSILSDQLPAPLSQLITTADSATLSRTDIAQPAIYTTSIACWHALCESNTFQKDQLTATAGLSLGEYTALTIAGVISFEDGLKLVTLRGRAMQDAAEASDGAMLALIGASEEQAYAVVDACKQSDVLVAANFNAPGQVVLSGATPAIDRAAVYAKEQLSLRVAKLDVAGAFHSPLMAPAAERLKNALDATSIGLPDVPVMANVSGQPHVVGEIRDALVRQLTSPVLWAKCVDYMRADERLSGKGWVELAPGKTLSGIMRKIDRKTKVTNYDEAPVEAV
eukprot:GFKZ01012763.1.p1 GENE.GFKZ01012763.1~~GFKZ01012763.1.p1  ORF type:complete len:345 (+),score=48.73 GFKZ01012763.1:252-1286(+)